MPRSTAPLRAALLPFLLLAAACGRVSGEAAAGEPLAEETIAASDAGVPRFELPSSEMLSSPGFRSWAGGDPTWSLSREDSDYLILRYTSGFSEDDDPALNGFPRMPEECYDSLGGGEGGYPAEECLYPVLRQLVGEDALRYYRETGGSMVLGLAGDGPVRVADIWWGPYGPNDHPAAQILTPQGFMGSSPHSWAPYFVAEQEAVAQEVLQRIIDATAEGGPYYFNHVYPWEIAAPARTPAGWEVATTSHLIGGCHACDVEFGARFVLAFDEAGTPTGARFEGYCWYDYYATDNYDADRAAIDALRTELPMCEPSKYPESIIDWENPSQWQE